MQVIILLTTVTLLASLFGTRGFVPRPLSARQASQASRASSSRLQSTESSSEESKRTEKGEENNFWFPSWVDQNKAADAITQNTHNIVVDDLVEQWEALQHLNSPYPPRNGSSQPPKPFNPLTPNPIDAISDMSQNNPGHTVIRKAEKAVNFMPKPTTVTQTHVNAVRTNNQASVPGTTTSNQNTSTPSTTRTTSVAVNGASEAAATEPPPPAAAAANNNLAQEWMQRNREAPKPPSPEFPKNVGAPATTSTSTTTTLTSASTPLPMPHSAQFPRNIAATVSTTPPPMPHSAQFPRNIAATASTTPPPMPPSPVLPPKPVRNGNSHPVSNVSTFANANAGKFAATGTASTSSIPPPSASVQTSATPTNPVTASSATPATALAQQWTQRNRAADFMTPDLAAAAQDSPTKKEAFNTPTTPTVSPVVAASTSTPVTPDLADVASNQTGSARPMTPDISQAATATLSQAVASLSPKPVIPNKAPRATLQSHPPQDLKPSQSGKASPLATTGALLAVAAAVGMGTLWEIMGPPAFTPTLPTAPTTTTVVEEKVIPKANMVEEDIVAPAVPPAAPVEDVTTTPVAPMGDDVTTPPVAVDPVTSVPPTAEVPVPYCIPPPPSTAGEATAP